MRLTEFRVPSHRHGLRITAALCLTLGLAAQAAAEVTIDEIVTGANKGRTTRADRYPKRGGYDVKIAPPPRPGARPVPAKAQTSDSIRPAARPLEREDDPTTAPPAADAPAQHKRSDPAPVAPAPAPVAARPEREPLRALTEEAPRHTGPYITIQVGAYRSEENAAELEAELAEQFPETYVHKVTSGGKPLFRVRVGHFTDPGRAESVRKRIVAAGYPAFQANEPGD
jgi:cell division protein FtsN